MSASEELRMPLTAVEDNPYVGPRSFGSGNQLFGRDRETEALIDLLLAERIVLLHSQSGAGKTSLIHAAIIPRLRDEGFEVLPTIRVSRPLLPDDAVAGANRYVVSALRDLSMDGAVEDRAGTVDDRLDTWVAGHTTMSSPTLLIFDQFEELLTLDATDRDAKQEFCRQVGALLADRNRWAIVAMREEFIGGLAPFLNLIPTRLANRFRLELLSPDAARECIRRPAQLRGVEYDDGAVNRLVEDLRRVRQQTSTDTFEDRPGPFIEPVHLQVVCTNLWSQLPPATTRIQEAQVANVGTLDSALGGYFAGAAEAAAIDGACDERSLREYIGKAFIVNGVRAQTLAGKEKEFGVSAAAIEALDKRYVIRRDERRGGIWYELSHDRLIVPVLRDNERWKAAKDPEVFKMAEEWDRLGRPFRLLAPLQVERAVRALLELRHRQGTGKSVGGRVETVPLVVRDYNQASQRFMRGFYGATFAFAALLFAAAYFVTTSRENSSLKEALLRERLLRDSVVLAVDSAKKVSNVLYQKAWGLEDTSAKNVQVSVAINKTLQRVAKASPAAERRDFTINYYAKRSDAQRVEFALKELGFTVNTRPAYAEDIATNAVSYGPDVPTNELRIVALAIARSGAVLRRVCPFLAADGRERTIEIIGSSQAMGEPPLTLADNDSFDASSGVHCNRRPARAR